MRVLLQPEDSRDDQRAHMRALADAIRACGDYAEVVPLRTPAKPRIEDFDAVCCWSWRRALAYRLAAGKHVLVMERGYVGDRFRWTSMGWNGLNGRARFPKATDAGARWERHFSGVMKPWRAVKPGYALIMGQVPSDTAVRGTDFRAWSREAAVAMRRRGFDIRFRPHPQATHFSCGAPVVPGTLDQALAGAALAVTFNSNAGVDAVLAGVPTITCDDGAMARAVSGHGLAGGISTPDRAAWAHNLAWSQFAPEEFALPETWARLKAVLN